MLAPAALLSAAALAVSLGVAYCTDATTRTVRAASFGAAQDAIQACVGPRERGAEPLRLVLSRRE